MTNYAALQEERKPRRDTARPRVGVVIVHYPSAEDVEQCVESLTGAGDVIADMVVVDNASPDRLTPAICRDRSIEVLRCPDNVGFARAANLGARRVCGDLLLFLNPDVRVCPSDLAELVETLQGEARIGAVAPNLLLPDGRSQVGAGGYLPTLRSVAAHSFFLPRWLPGGFDKPFMVRLVRAGQRASDRDRGNGRELVSLDWVSGACMMVRRTAFEEVGGFDESFFLYGEDIDLGRRLRAAGWQVVMRPDVAVRHLHSPNDASEARASVTAWIDGLDDYYRRHTPRSRRALHAIGALGLLGRTAIRALRASLPGSEPENRETARRLLSYARRSIEFSILPRG
jgi:GT2 family glycosyltransferase